MKLRMRRTVLSMGIGSYTSVKAQREVRIGVLEKIKLIVKYVP